MDNSAWNCEAYSSFEGVSYYHRIVVTKIRWSLCRNKVETVKTTRYYLSSFTNRDHHHHRVVPPAQIFLTLSRHFSLSFIASGRSSGLHPVSSHSCCMYVRAGRPAFARPYVGVLLEYITTRDISDKY